MARPCTTVMRLLALAALLALPLAGGTSFATVAAPAPEACGEGCALLDPAERVVAIEPAPGMRALWLVEDDRGLTLAGGVARSREMVELPEGAARLRVRAL